MAVTRIKVPRLTLIERIQERIDKEIAEREKALEEYGKAVEAWMAQVPEALEKMAKEIRDLKGDEIQEYFKELNVDRWDKHTRFGLKLKKSLPSHPGRREYGEYTYVDKHGYRQYGFEGYIESLRHTKRILEASNEETISVSTNDRYAQFL